MPGPSQMTDFCREGMPKLLRDSGVDPDEATAIGDDVLLRARAFTALPDNARDVVIAPSIEEIYSYEPREADLALLAAVNVVVRNSLLEEAHANGPITSKDIRLVTIAAAAPMSQHLAEERHGRDPRA